MTNLIFVASSRKRLGKNPCHHFHVRIPMAKLGNETSLYCSPNMSTLKELHIFQRSSDSHGKNQKVFTR